MSIWGSRPSTPAPRPGIPTPSKLVMPWSSKPAPKPGVKPVVKPGFLENKFRKESELITEVKKSSYFKSIPTYGKKFIKDERTSLIKELEKKSGAIGGLSDKKLDMGIKKLIKEKQAATYHKEFGKIKALDQKIKEAQTWKKSW